MIEDERAVLQDVKRSVDSLKRRQDSAGARAWETATRIFVPICTLAMAGLVTWIMQIDRAVAMNTSASDQNAVAIKRAEARIDKMPPEWLSVMVQELKTQNMDILQRLARVEALIKSKE